MDSNISITIHSVVATTRSREEVEAYLYAHTTIVESVTDGSAPRNGFILATTVHGEMNTTAIADMQREAEYLALYQGDRFASGLIHCQVIGTKRDAYCSWTRWWRARSARPTAT